MKPEKQTAISSIYKMRSLKNKLKNKQSAVFNIKMRNLKNKLQSAVYIRNLKNKLQSAVLI